MTKKVELADLLTHISTELLKAHNEAKSKGEATMEFKDCEMEFAVETTKEGKAGIKVWLLNLTGGAKKSDSNTIKIRFGAISGKSIQAEQEMLPEPGPKITKQ